MVRMPDSLHEALTAAKRESKLAKKTIRHKKTHRKSVTFGNANVEQNVEEEHNGSLSNLYPTNHSPSPNKRKASFLSPEKPVHASKHHNSSSENYAKVASVTQQLHHMQDEFHHLTQLLRNTLPLSHLPPEAQDDLRSTSVNNLEFTEKDVEKLIQDMHSNVTWYKNYMDVPEDVEMELTLNSDIFNGDIDAYVEEVGRLKVQYDKSVNGQPTPYVQPIPNDYWDWKKSTKRKSMNLRDVHHREDTSSDIVPPLKVDGRTVSPTQPSSNSSSARQQSYSEKSAKETKLPVTVPDCLNEHFIERLVISALLKDFNISEQQYAFKEQESKVFDLEIELINQKIAQIETLNEKKSLVKEVCEDRLESATEEIEAVKRKNTIFAKHWRNRFTQLRDEICDYKDKLLVLDKEVERQHVLHRDHFRKAKARYERRLAEINQMKANTGKLQIYKEMFDYYMEDANFLKRKSHEKEDEIFTLSSNINSLLYEKQNLIDALAEFKEIDSPVKSFLRTPKKAKGLSVSTDMASSVRERNRKEMFPSMSVLKNTTDSTVSSKSELSLPHIHENSSSGKGDTPNKRVPIQFV
eukprot:CAMPEP_0117449750 /NCGR_PEP_ID=MMETSP0759-20121206/8105_1 /TAXON_ID=63605 /ORGANISM="Percolomonas cosmopolitus, Strain WS" /LENGTH=579 /DNA_ID=CAMNT_0005242233 /DNA_START=169 /DNA_END=1908 /DNA_ORIENTATION=-